MSKESIKRVAVAKRAARPSASLRQLDDQIKLDAWATVFEKTNRIVSGDNVRVSLLTQSELRNLTGVATPPPGVTAGSHIHLNRDVLKNMVENNTAVQTALQMKGLNYHELSHVMYTPRTGSDFSNAVGRLIGTYGHLAMKVANLLEDQRIETWFSAAYSPSKRYFEAMCISHMLSGDDGGGENVALLLHGRKFLSPKIRVKARLAYEAKYGAENYAKATKIIDEYIVTDPITHGKKSGSLVEQMVCLLIAGNTPVPDEAVSDGHEVESDRTTGQKSKTSSAKERREAKEAAQKASDEQAKADADEAKAQEADEKASQEQADEAGDGNGDSEGQDAEGDAGSGEADGDGEAGDGASADAASGDASDGDDDGEGAEGGTGNGDTSTSSDAGGEGASAKGEGNQAPPTQQAIKDAIEQRMEEISSDETLMADVKNTLRAVQHVISSGRGNSGSTAKSTMRATTPEDAAVVRKVQKTFQRVFSQAEPEIMRAQTAGRMDTRRMLQARPNDFDIFTSYDEGSEDEAGVEMVILIDESGSMSGRLMVEACLSAWTLKRACDKAGIRCTVVLFDSDHRILYKASDKATSQVRYAGAMGGTEPSGALNHALKVLRQSAMPNKVLVTVTDGGWGYADEVVYDPIMKDIHSIGTTSLMLGLSGAVKAYGAHGHQIARDLNRAGDMVKPVTEMVELLIRRSISNH